MKLPLLVAASLGFTNFASHVRQPVTYQNEYPLIIYASTFGAFALALKLSGRGLAGGK
jgi:hypothetical protein